MKDLRVYLKAAGLVIKAWREQAGMSQAQLAERASAVMPVPANLPRLKEDDISNLERGIVKRLEFADIERICIALGRGVGEFSPAVERQLEKAEKLLQAEQYLRKIRRGDDEDTLTLR
ncbi:MAG: helix-turn-helix domain-containing protein [Fimbriimonadales bacterium]|nr:helix-turn-helix domain-containing protein [Fimbriimonadales bacterium]